MRRLLLFALFGLLLVGIAPANAQGILGGGYVPSSPEGWYYYLRGDQVHMLQADQINWIAETMNIGRRAQMRRVTDDLMWNGSQLGLQGPKGFYPMYNCSGRQRLERGAGSVIMSTIGGYVLGRTTGFGGKKGAIAGAAAGTGYALYRDAKCDPAQNSMIVIDDPSDVQGFPPQVGGPQMMPMPSQPQNGWNDILRNQANAGGSLFGSYRGCMEQNLFTLKNESGEIIRVFKDGQPFIVLRPRQSECGDPFSAYDAEIISAVADGYTATAAVVRAKPEGRSGGVWVWR